MNPLLIAMFLLLSVMGAQSQLHVFQSSPKLTGQKALVKLALKNDLPNTVQSARAAVFVLNQKGEMLGEGARWVIGGDGKTNGLAPGATNQFFFVVNLVKPVTDTNVTARIHFNKLLLEGGKQGDVKKDVVITPATK